MFDLIPHFPKGCTVPEPKAQMCWLNFLGWNFPTRKENFWATKYYHCFHALVFYFATETHPVDLVWSITLFRLDQMCMVGKGFQRSLWSKNHYPPCKNQKEIEMKMIFKNPVFSWTLKRRKFGNTKIQKCKPTKRKAMNHSWQCKRCQGKIPDLLLSDTISSSSDAISCSSDRLFRGQHPIMSWWTWLPICMGLCMMSGRFRGAT